ncbi:MAG: FixG Ig-like domain-containing protein, partial [Candidatus Bathyarchaeia archaeon]
AFGPLNGLAQPWGTPWYGRNEPNKMLLNTVEWLVGKATLKEELINELKALNREAHLTVENQINILASIMTKIYVETKLNPAWEFAKWGIGFAAGIYADWQLLLYAPFLYDLMEELGLDTLLDIEEAHDLAEILPDLYTYLKDHPDLNDSTIKNMHYNSLMNTSIKCSGRLFNDIPSYLTSMDEELQTLVSSLSGRTIPDDICSEMINETRRIRDWVEKVRSEEASIIYIDLSQETIMQARVAGALSSYPACVDDLIKWFERHETINNMATGVTVSGLAIKAIKVISAFFGVGIPILATIPIETVAEVMVVGGYVGYEVSKIARDLTKEQALSIVETQALPTALGEVKSVGEVYSATLRRIEEWIEMGDYSAEISVELKPSVCVVQPKPISQVPAPSPVSYFDATVHGHVTIISSRDAPAAILVEIFESGSNHMERVVGPVFNVMQNVRKEVEFSYPLTGIFTPGESLKVYSVVVHVAIGPKIDTYSEIFTVVSKYASSVQGISASSFSGEAGEGESVLYQIDAPPGASELILALNYAGSDLDLHLYDSQGRHVGMNYESNEVELQIPHASYNGPDVSREWIIVSNLTGSQSFTAKVVGVEVDGKESFSLSYMIITRSIEVAPVASVVCPDHSTSYEVSIMNFGEREETYTLGLEGLKQEWYSFDPQTIKVEPGETAKVRLEVTVPSEASLGSYAFIIYASNIIGEVPASLEVARPEDVKTSVLSMLNALREYINALPQEAFSKEQTVTEMKKALSNKINAVIKMVEEGAYNGVINKLMNDILAKMDGDPKPKDWIIDSITQAYLRNYVNWIIINIKALL